MENNMEPKPVPYEVVQKLIALYEGRDKGGESSRTYEDYTEQITKTKAIIEYISKGEI